MKRVLCLRLPNWPIQRLRCELSLPAASALALHTPAGRSPASGGTVVTEDPDDLRFIRDIFTAARTGPAVVAVTEEAWARGVRPGLPLAEARSMAEPLTRDRKPVTRRSDAPVLFVEWSPQRDRIRLAELAEPLRRFAPVVAIDDMPVPDSLMLDVTGCGALFGGESALADELLRELAPRALTARVCIADTIAAAWAFTHADGHTIPLFERQRSRSDEAAEFSRLPVLIVPPGQELTYAADLPLASARIRPRDLSILSELGLRSLRQLMDLPADDLPARLSPDAVRRLRQLRGTDDEVLIPLPEADPIQAAWSSEFPATSLSEILSIVNLLMEQIESQLLRRRTGCIRLLCTLTDQARQLHEITAEVLRPLQHGPALAEVLRLRIEAERFRQPVVSVTLRASTAPMPVARQKDLFSATEHIVPQDELAALVNRLTGRLGVTAVAVPRAVADPRPECAVEFLPLVGSRDTSTDDQLRRLVTPESDGTVQPPADCARPLRLLPVPLPVAISGLSGSLSDSQIEWQNSRDRILNAQGPERIQTAWWTDAPAQRDYFRVVTSRHSTLWIFRDVGTGVWYLHGIFD